MSNTTESNKIVKYVYYKLESILLKNVNHHNHNYMPIAKYDPAGLAGSFWCWLVLAIVHCVV